MTDFMTVIDLETSGFRRDAKVMEIACVKVDEQFNVLDYFHTTVKSHEPMREAEAVHGISEQMTSESPEWPEVLDFVYQEFLMPCKIIGGANVSYDLRFIAPWKLKPTDEVHPLKIRTINIKNSLSKECQRHFLPEEGYPHYAIAGAIAAAACLKENCFGYLGRLKSLSTIGDMAVLPTRYSTSTWYPSHRINDAVVMKMFRDYRLNATACSDKLDSYI